MTNAARLHLHLLGGFRVTVDERPLRARALSRRPATLLTWLALAPGYRLHREWLMDALWPDLDLDAETNNLNVTLTAIRRLLVAAGAPPGHFLTRDREMLVLGLPEAVWVDVIAFDVADARAWREDDPAITRVAIDRYTGDLLPEDPFDERLDARRTMLRSSMLALLARLGGQHAARGEVEPAIEAFSRLVALEPAHEDGHVALMRLYALAGQRLAALQQYEQLISVLAYDLDVEPQAATQALAAAIRDGRFPESVRSLVPDEVVPAVVPDAATLRRGSLPTPLTTLVGREREIAEIAALLHGATRLVTLTGPGGVGKTRVALAVGHRRLDTYPDGVWFVDLAPLTDPDFVLTTVATTLAVPILGQQPVVDALITALRGRTCLLIVDNVEHVVDAAPSLTELLLACPHVALLATSRIPLHVSGEREYAVSSLPTPDSDASVEPQVLVETPSVTLFIDRAQAVKRDFQLTHDNAAAVADICRRLDGLPLAIELAAARVKLLSPADIVARLDRPLSILSGGARDLPERQQTLRATIQWSYDLLSPDGQRLLQWFSVFVGGWTLDAARAVVAGGNGRDIDIFDGLTVLTDNSLVRVRDDADGGVRCTMLETIREFGLEQLDDSESGASVRQRHALHFLDMAYEAEPHLNAGESSHRLQRLLRDRDNVRAMLDWGLTHDSAVTLNGAAALQWYWLPTGQMREGLDWLRHGLERGHDAPPLVQAKALNVAGTLAGWLGETESGIDLVEQSLAIYRQAGDQHGIATALFNLARNRKFAGDLAQSRTLNEESLALYQALGDAVGIESVSGNLGVVLAELGAYEQAGTLMQSALDMARRQRSELGIVIWLTNLGHVEALHGDAAQARHYLHESLIRIRDLQDRRFAAICLEALAYLGHDGNWEHSARLIGAAAALREESEYPVTRDQEADYTRIVSRTQEALDLDRYDAAWQQGYAMTLDQAIDIALKARDDQ